MCVYVCASPSRSLYCRRILLLLLLHPALFFSSQNRIVSHSREIVIRNGLTADRRRRSYQTTMGYVAYIIKIIVGQLQTYTYITYLWAISTIRSNILKVEMIPTQLIIFFEQLLLLLLKKIICQQYIIVLQVIVIFNRLKKNLNV